MEIKLKKLVRKKLMKVFVIPVILLGVWFLLTTWYIIFFDQSVLVLSFGHTKDSFTKVTYNKLLKGDTVTGRFIAKDNNLGIVAVRFQKFERVPYKNEDLLVFRLRQKGEKKWYYENKYRSGFIYDLPLLPFGFPLIPDSKGKTYEFQIESLKGNSQNAMAINNKREPVIFSKYQFSKTVIFSTPKELWQFGIKKYVNSLQTIDVVYSSFVFLLPLFFYLLWISPFKSKVLDPIILYLNILTNRIGKKMLGKYYITVLYLFKESTSHFFITFLLITIVVDIFILQVLNDMVYIVVIIIWIILLKAYHLKSNLSFILGLLLLCTALIFYQGYFLNITERASVWAYIFLVIATIQAVFEVKNKEAML